jgi:hypothetical protein
MLIRLIRSLRLNEFILVLNFHYKVVNHRIPVQIMKSIFPVYEYIGTSFLFVILVLLFHVLIHSTPLLKGVLFNALSSLEILYQLIAHQYYMPYFQILAIFQVVLH